MTADGARPTKRLLSSGILLTAIGFCPPSRPMDGDFPRLNDLRSRTLSFSGSYHDLNKEIYSRIGLGTREKSRRDNPPSTQTAPSRYGYTLSYAGPGFGIRLDGEHSMWSYVKSMFGYGACDNLQEHWSFSKLHVVSELRSAPDDYLCSVRHLLTGHMALCRVLRRKARPHPSLFEMEKKCWRKVSFCVQVRRGRKKTIVVITPLLVGMALP